MSEIIVVTSGKGGVGKTTFAATLARLYAQEGKNVLAADVDPDANLGLALGFSEEDLELLWEAIINMFENDHSAARGKMCMRKLYVFKHSNILGNCPSHLLFEKIKVDEENEIPRCFDDYKIEVDEKMPEGVELIEKL